MFKKVKNSMSKFTNNTLRFNFKIKSELQKIIGRIFLFSFVPISFFLYCYQLNSLKGQYFYSTYADPSYLYLASSLQIGTAHFPTHVDNPGAPTQLLGAITFRVTHIFSGKDTFSEDVLQRPEHYLKILNLTLLLLLGLSLYVGGWIAFKLTHNYIVAILLQMSFLFFPSYENAYGLLRISPEIFLMIWSLCWACLMLRLIARGDAITNARFYWIAYGLLSGIGVATKLNFLPHCIFPFFILVSWRHKIYYFLLSVCSFVFFAFFQLFSSDKLFLWTRDLFFNSGIYATGKRNFIDWHSFFENLQKMYHSEKLFFAIIIASSIFAILIHTFGTLKSKFPILARISIGISTIMFLHILMIAKHYHHRYLLPVMLLAVAALIGAVFVFLRTSQKPLLSYGLVFLLIVIFYFHSSPLIQGNYQMVTTDRIKGEKVERFLAKFPQKTLRIPYYGASSVAGSIWFGVYSFLPGSNSFQYLDKTLRKNYPNHLFYNGGNFYDLGKIISIDSALSNHDRFLFQGWAISQKPTAFRSFKVIDSLFVEPEVVYVFEKAQ
jgi:hypothetical protein